MDYKDHVSITTQEEVTWGVHNLDGVLSMRVREFPNGTYAFFMHIHVCLVESFHGPLSEIQKAHDRVEEVRRTLGPKVTWSYDEPDKSKRTA